MYILGVPLGLAINILLARQLGPTEFGQYSFIVSVLALLVMPVSGGLPQLLTREIARFSQSEQWGLYRGVIKAAHAWVLIVAIIVMVIYYVFHIAGIIPTESKWALLSIIVLLVPLQGLNAVRNGTIKGLGLPALAEMPLQTIQPLLYLSLLGVLSLTATMSAAQALWAQVVVTAITFLIASVLFQKISPSTAKTFVAEYRVFSWLRSLLPFALISLVGTFNAQIVIVLLGLMGTDEAVGALRVADRGAQLVALPLALVNMVIGPYVVRVWQSNDRETLQSMSRKASRGALLLALPVAIILIFFGKSIIGVAFGEAYVESSYLALAILVCGQLINVALGPLGLMLSMAGKERLTLYSYIASVLITFVVAFVLIPNYGQVGAALSAVSGIVSVKIVTAVAAVRLLKIRPGIL